MKICFSSNKVEKICNDRKAALKHLPTPKHADKLFQRLQELASCSRLVDIPTSPPLRRHKLSGKLKDFWAVDLVNKHDGWRICFLPVDYEKAPDGSIDFETIVSICIERITDHYNG